MPVNEQVNHRIQAVIFDWAGTVVDYGCFAPVSAFMDAFRPYGVELTNEEVRAPMGLPKLDHIRAICQMTRISNRWLEKFGRLPNDEDAVEINGLFESFLFEQLARPEHTQLIPGVAQLVERLRGKGIKIGSTTGYTAEMMKIVAAKAAEQGYKPDVLVTPSEVPAGRPYPWMCYVNAMQMGVYPSKAIIKVGDTTADIEEGRNAGMWSVGVIHGSSELGLTEKEIAAMDPGQLTQKEQAVRETFFRAGADYVMTKIEELDAFMDLINDRM